jgi:hydroxyethylthiazole kinase
MNLLLWAGAAVRFIISTHFTAVIEEADTHNREGNLVNDMIADIINRVRTDRPLVQAITNYVTINDCANILLGFGASPAMCEAREEVEEFAPVVNALYLNLGTLTAEQRDAMPKAAHAASGAGIPIIIDPVGAGGIKGRDDFVRSLLESSNISIVKGNLGEIKALAGLAAGIRGVDSTDDGENAVEACRALAGQYHTVVAATGEIDTISDGTRVVQIRNGHALLTRITGAGCMAGALASATAAVETDSLLAAVAALASMGVAAEMAADGPGQYMGPGTFRIRLFDSIYNLQAQDVSRAGKITWL